MLDSLLKKRLNSQVKHATTHIMSLQKWQWDRKDMIWSVKTSHLLLVWTLTTLFILKPLENTTQISIKNNNLSNIFINVFNSILTVTSTSSNLDATILILKSMKKLKNISPKLLESILTYKVLFWISEKSTKLVAIFQEPYNILAELLSFPKLLSSIVIWVNAITHLIFYRTLELRVWTLSTKVRSKIWKNVMN